MEMCIPTKNKIRKNYRIQFYLEYEIPLEMNIDVRISQMKAINIFEKDQKVHE